MSQTNHTPTPWIAETVGVSSTGPDGVDVCEITSENGHARIAEYMTEPNAAFIVTACNAYDAHVATIAELMAALRQLIAQHDRPHGFEDENWYARQLEVARAALAKAGA